MKPDTRIVPPAMLTVVEAAALIGVSRQRIHQRLHHPDRTLPSLDTSNPKASTKSYGIVPNDALTWRAEREAAGEPVGPLPPWAQPVPAHPPEVPDLPPVPQVIRGIGIHGFRPF